MFGVFFIFCVKHCLKNLKHTTLERLFYFEKEIFLSHLKLWLKHSHLQFHVFFLNSFL